MVCLIFKKKIHNIHIIKTLNRSFNLKKNVYPFYFQYFFTWRIFFFNQKQSLFSLQICFVILVKPFVVSGKSLPSLFNTSFRHRFLTLSNKSFQQLIGMPEQWLSNWHTFCKQNSKISTKVANTFWIPFPCLYWICSKIGLTNLLNNINIQLS